MDHVATAAGRRRQIVDHCRFCCRADLCISYNYHSTLFLVFQACKVLEHVVTMTPDVDKLYTIV